MERAKEKRKLCECGCGEPTPVSKYTSKRDRTVKGQAVRFVLNHAHKGKIVSDTTRKRLSNAHMGKNRTNTPTYRTLHARLCSRYPKQGICEQCKQKKRTYYALVHGHQYTDKLEDYYELCMKCHFKYDLGGKLLSSEHRATLSIAQKRRWIIRKQQGLGKYGSVI